MLLVLTSRLIYDILYKGGIMANIKDISILDGKINMEIEDGYVIDIQVKDEQSLKFFSKAYSETKYDLKSIKYYNKCADISLFPIWISLVLLAGGYVTNFALMDMLLIVCGGMSGLSLLSLGTFKLVSSRLKSKVCSNKYWHQLYNYTLENKKTNFNSKSKKIEKSNNRQYSGNNITYSYNRNEITHDEISHYKKR